MTRNQADYSPPTQEIDGIDESARTLRRVGVSVSSAQNFADNQAQRAISLLRWGSVDATDGSRVEAFVSSTYLAGLIEERINNHALYTTPESLVTQSMLPAIRDRLLREGAMIDEARLSEIVTGTIRHELLVMDSQRNGNDERDWNINLTELNEYRVQHGLPAQILATEEKSR